MKAKIIRSNNEYGFEILLIAESRKDEKTLRLVHSELPRTNFHSFDAGRARIKSLLSISFGGDDDPLVTDSANELEDWD